AIATPPPRPQIPAPPPPRPVLNWRIPSRGQAEGARCTGRRRRRCRWVDKQRGIALRTLLWERRSRCCGLTAIRQHAPFDGTQPPHFAAHLDLRLTVQVEYRLGPIPQKGILAVAKRHAPKPLGKGRDERRP